MANINVAILGAPDFGKDLGKKGTASDLTFYNLKKHYSMHFLCSFPSWMQVKFTLAYRLYLELAAAF